MKCDTALFGTISTAVLWSATAAFAQTPAAPPWARHAIDPATDSRQGADGVRLADANGDGRLDTVTGWEEGNAVRVCLHPGVDAVKQPWPSVTVGEVRSAEDAVFVDLDGDGNLDVISCTEGRQRTVFVHWAPERTKYLDASSWRTEPIPATERRQSWMFALPMQVDGKDGVDLVVGSKGKRACVGWLQSPRNPRELSEWTFHRIVDAGWIMSLRASSPNQPASVWASDRKGKSRGVLQLVPNVSSVGVSWRPKRVGGGGHEVMFLDLWPATGEPLVATRNGVVLDLASESVPEIANPFGVRWGKAVRIGDIDGDGEPDILATANTGGSKSKPGVAWLERTPSGWREHDISGLVGSKFDRIELVDLDGDGDLDVITCEENAGADSRGLGLIWYENPSDR